jgi:gluconate 2-dehydrogenase gamma chain
MYPDEKEEREPSSRELSRRELMVTTAFVPLAALVGSAHAAAQTATTAAAAPTALSAAQMKILEAFVERLIPKDELGPSAAEAGAQIYIDRVLAGPNANEKGTFIDGLTSMDAFARTSQGAAFAELSPEKRDVVITAVEAGTADGFPSGRAFFNRARRLTLEGMFGDPYYGGNKNFAGWDLIRYPGPRPATSPDDQKMGVEPKPYRVSAWGTKYGH